MLRNRLLPLFLLPLSLLAQVIDYSGNSLFSQMSYGDLSSDSYTRNIGMGGTGVSNFNRLFINGKNPALISYNNLSVGMDFGFGFDKQTFETKTVKTSTYNTRLDHIIMTFPISKKLVISTGLKPYSRSKYNYSGINSIQGDSNKMVINNRGAGGLNQAMLTFAVPITETFRVGVTGSYIFGLFDDYTANAINGIQASGYEMVVKDQTNMKIWDVKLGASYRKRLTNKDHFLTLGATYNINSSIETKNSRIIGRYNIFQQPLFEEPVSGTNTKTTLPSFIQSGLTISKFDSSGKFDAWTVSTDLEYGNWDNTIQRNVINPTSSSRVSLGGEYAPKKYKGLIFLRTGAYRNKLPYSLNGNTLIERGVTLGFSMKLNLLRTKKAFFDPGRYSYMTFTADMGRRGSVENNLIQENYFRFMVGINVNDFWFIRPKID